MTVNRKPTGTAASIPSGLASGFLTAAVITLAGALITAKLIDKEIIQWKDSGYGVLMILLVSSWLGSTVTAGRVKRQRLAMCIGAGALYFCLLLLSSALFFGGQYSGVGETALLIFCGSMLGVFTAYPGRSRRKRIKMQ